MKRCLAIGGAITLTASAAHANDPPRARLDYRAPLDSECPDERVFRDLVAARVGRDPFAADGSRTVEATLEKRDAHFRGRVALVDAAGKGRGERELDDPSCAVLAESLAVAVSIMLDPFGRWAKSSPAPSPESSPPLAPARPSPPDTPEVAPSAAKPAQTLTVMPTLSLTSTIGAAPDILWGGRLGARLTTPHWSGAAEIGFETLLATARVGIDRVEANRILGAVTPCLRVDALGLCATATVGVFEGRATNVVIPVSRRTLVADGGLRAQWTIRLGHTIVLEPWLAVTIPIVRTTLVVSDESIWRASWVAASLGLSVLAFGT